MRDPGGARETDLASASKRILLVAVRSADISSSNGLSPHLLALARALTIALISARIHARNAAAPGRSGFAFGRARK